MLSRFSQSHDGPKSTAKGSWKKRVYLDSFLYTKKAACFMLCFGIYEFCGSGMELRVTNIVFPHLSCCDIGSDMVLAFASHGPLVE